MACTAQVLVVAPAVLQGWFSRDDEDEVGGKRKEAVCIASQFLLQSSESFSIPV